MNASTKRIHNSFWIIAVMALMWNIMGVMSFIGQTTMSQEALNALPDQQRAMYEAVPMWLNIVFAIATMSGLLGSIGLLKRKSWATLLFFISLVAVLIQMGYNLFMTNAAEILGPTATGISIVLILASIFFYFYSKSAENKGWLT